MIMPWEKYADILNKCRPVEYEYKSKRVPIGNIGEPIEPEQSAKADNGKPKQDSAKHDTGKPRCDLVSPALIEAVGYVRGYGTDKYGSSENWKQVESSRFMAALIRHLCHCMRDLNSVDEESGLPHLWHVATNVNFLMERVEVKQ